MVATVVIVDSDVALYTDPFSGTEAEDTVLDDRNGIACCCGLPSCTTCCDLNAAFGCCYRGGSSGFDEIVNFSALVQRFETNEPCHPLPRVEVAISQTGFGIIGKDQFGRCIVTIPVSARHRQWNAICELSIDTTQQLTIQPSLNLLGGPDKKGVGLLADMPQGQGPNWLGWFLSGTGAAGVFHLHQSIFWDSDFHGPDTCDQINQDVLYNPEPFQPFLQHRFRMSMSVVHHAQECLNNCTVCPP